MADINRLKVVLVEKKKNQQVVSFRVEERSCNRIKMVYEHFTT